VANPAFDITPARLIDSFITERGLVEPGALRHVFGGGTP
jgi:methylthioribose-1-phosphate isomerase